MQVDPDSAFHSYQQRFVHEYGDKPEASFVKFGNHMVQKLTRSTFDKRLQDYLLWHSECKKLLGSGATISDAIVLEFEEAAAWLIIRAPNILEMFQGELGDPGDRLASKPANASEV